MQRFRVLDSWRGVAALCVALFHYPSGGLLPTIPFVSHSWLFVDFFFVLSGFVIAHAYGERLTDGTSFWVFVIRRIGRLWPLHIATLIPLVLLETAKWASVQAGVFDAARMVSPPFTSPFSLHDLASNIVFAQAILSALNPFLDQIKFIGGWNSPSWTISVEFWTSIIFATACLAAPKRLVPLAILAIVGTMLWLCIVGPGTLGVGIDFGVSRALLGFASGYLIYRLYRSGKAPMRSAAAEIAALAGVIAIVSVVGDNALSFLALPIFAFCVYVFAHEAGPLSKLLSTGAATKLGEWSFSIYLVHFVILEFVLAGAQASTYWGYPLLGAGAGPGVFEATRPLLIVNGAVTDLLAIPYLACVLIVSSFTYRWIEAPARDWANAYSLRWAARQRARLEGAPATDGA